jgi:hypothetical protein
MNRIYTTAQLLHALARVKDVVIPGRVTRVDISAGPDGACLVKLVEESRDSSHNLECSITLTADETRAWRSQLHAATDLPSPATALAERQ